jgi:oligoendopeptidase F
MSSLAARSFVDSFNVEYESKHRAFEEQFWGTKMALSGNFSSELLSSTKASMESLLSSAEVLEKAQAYAAACSETDKALKTSLDIIIRTCKCYQMPLEAKSIREATAKLESDLEMARNSMKLGYSVESTFHEASSVALRNLMVTSGDETTRKACYHGLRSVGPFVLDNGFIEIIKRRNQVAKLLGFEDYYDYKVQNAEGFGKKVLFEILDTLEQGTRATMERARKDLVAMYGDDALDPWNTSYKMSGSIVKKMDPYFPFQAAVERYMTSYVKLGITYQGATMNLDLLDRPKKYSNGFCHWPQPAWIKPDGTFQPTVTNFTSLADPSAIGSGLIALTTLMHEAGHAAHFANIQQPSPLCSQERSPTSVAYAENQSMFLDSLVSDSAWRAKYAKKKNGDPIPFDILEQGIRATHPYAVFQLRGMLSVSYFEKALYELSEDLVTKENVMALADRLELEVQGGFSGRPLLSVPHLVSDEASCYYHGYTLAEMSVHQTRAFFKQRDGYIVDNPKVGPTLKSAYWECGNSRPFLDLVKGLTGKELSGDDWVSALQETVEDKVKREKTEYDEALAIATSDESTTNLDSLDMTVKFVDGDEVISDSSQGGILEACKKFEAFVDARVADKAIAAAS